MMKVTSEFVKEFIGKYRDDVPIFVSEIKEYFGKEEMAKVYVYINRMVKSGELKTFCSGVYYKGHISRSDVIDKKYIKNNGIVFGYYVGDMVVSNVCNKGSSYYNRTLGVKVKRPRVLINNDNYKYLELLDNIKYGYIKFEEVSKFISNNNLCYEEFFKNALIYENRKYFLGIKLF